MGKQLHHSKSAGAATQVLKGVEPLMQNALDSSLEGEFLFSCEAGMIFLEIVKFIEFLKC